ncbi:MAG TPA: 6,7-dimethyl-8-ribityllumazine synthase [Flavitalea sp.]|nr:6,7-dimethyl-8-ribityllumazine synthase [Flavitalea sp.]
MAEVTNSKLLQIDAGIPEKNACIVIVRTEWNAVIVDELENGCKKTLSLHGVKNIKSLTVPGAFEIPFGIKKYWDLNKYKDDRPLAFIALGCVLRGDTPHFEYVCRGVTDGVVQLNLLLPVPTIFGILTVDTHQQAEDRIGGRHGHKGEEAAITAIKMILLQNSFKK